MASIKCYRELSRLHTFEERFNYLKLYGCVGFDTFGFDRYMNQQFYRSREWRRIRDFVITRDLGCDLGIEGYDINDRIVVHHMNPIFPNDITMSTDILLDPEYLITTTHDTHNAIHYGDGTLLQRTTLIERLPNDTCPWLY